MASGLEKYRAKRRFGETPEPAGTIGASGEPMFVIQKHRARQLHYDLRLEMGGVLKSWAVPQGPCLDPKVRRFAKLTEDHPIEYGHFEGRIPEGNYGAGNVIIWDTGTYVALKDPEQGLADGEIKFRLAGHKLTGGWTLVRLKDDPTNWLLIKERDPSVRPIDEYDVLVEAPNSVITGKPVEEPAPEPRKAVKRKPPGKIPGAVAAALPSTWKPQLATPADAAPRGAKGWIHEIKYDGYRTLAFIDHGQVRLLTRNGHDWTHRYTALAKALSKLPCKTALLDGEVVVQDPRGVARLDLLEQALSDGASHAMTYFAFDLMHLDGYDLSAAALLDRKQALAGLLSDTVDSRSAVQLSDYFEGEGDPLFQEASRMGLEGIVSKKADSRYVQSRSANWLKVKRVEIDRFVVIGFLQNMPRNASSLILAEEREEGLEYACRVGSGISEDFARELYTALEPNLRAKPILPTPPTPGAKWVEPTWSVEIGYRSRSRIGAPRAPVLLSIAPWKPKPAVQAVRKPRLVSDRDLANIHLTNPGREFGDSGVTKLDVAVYYARVGDWLLPEVLRRPVTVIRCPTGDLKDLFYQRHAFQGLPPGVETVELSDEKERAAFIAITEPRGYLGLPQFGAMEFHLWGCRIDDPEHPDRIVLDLDPDESLPWARVCDGAEILRERLQAMGLNPFLRTTGGKGLHLVLALKPRHDWPTVKGFAEAVARAAAADHPTLFTAVSGKERRRGKIFIDYIRNARGASAVASYSLRARPNFPVATPIAWEELRRLSGGDAFDRLTVVRRLETLAADPWEELVSSSSELTAKMRRDVGMKR